MSALDALAARIEKHARIRRDEAMSRHTTFGVGGPADIFATVESAEELKAVALEASQAGAAVFVLGSGSNIVVSDKGIRGVVIDNRFRTEEAAGEMSYRIGSGASFAGYARKMCRQGRSGLAWAVGIPGTLGGAAVYNAGAYGGCLGDVLRRVRLLDHESGEDAWHDAAELGLVYRGSAFTRGTFAGKSVIEADVELSQGDPAALLAEAASYDTRRLKAQPRGRNAGSMFKNPAEQPAWKLIEAVGLRGASLGDAAISDKHANFFVNYGQARAADVNWLVEEAERLVFEQFGIRLEREVAFVGDWS